MSSMVIEDTSPSSDSPTDTVNANTGTEGACNAENMASTRMSNQATAFKVASCHRIEERINGSAEAGSFAAIDVEPCTSTAVSRSLSPSNLDRRPLSNRAGNSVSRSSCKRKPALPRKRPSTMQEPVIISAETGEAVDDDTAFSFDSGCLVENTSINKNCRVGIGITTGTTGTCNSELQRFETVTDECAPADLYDTTNIANKKCKHPSTPDAKSLKLSEQLLTQQNGFNGSNLPNINDVLIASGNAAVLNAAMNSFLLASAAAGADAANAFITPEMLASLSAAGLLPSLGVPCDPNLTDSMFSADQQQNANMLLLEAAAATAAGTIRDLLGTVPANGQVTSDIMSNGKLKPTAVPSTSVTAEVIATGTPNIVFNNEDGVIRKHDRRLKGRFAANGKAVTVGEHVVNMLNLGEAKRQSTKAVKCKIGDIKMNIKRRGGDESLDGTARTITKEERIDLDELESFAQTFKKQRIKFGFTQGDVGLALGRRYGTDFSQTTISRFEALNLSFKNMCKLRPLLKEWLEDAEAALAGGATISDLLDAPSKEPVQQRSPPAVHLPVTTNKLTPAVSSHNNNTMESQKMASDDSPSPNGSTAGTSSGAPLKKRRKRTNLDLAQRSALDAFFDMNARPDHDRMAEIAEIVGLDRDVVRVWFCNRRQKLRKE